MQALSCDVAIIGSGLAGLSAALVCANKGLRVLVCAKSNPGSGSCTAISQGHFRASVPGFSPQEHRHLTLEAGQGLNQAQTVDILVHRAEKAVRELETCGVRLQSRAKGFDTHPDRIGGEGVQITKPLVTCARSAGVTFLTPFHAWRMVTIQGHAAGVLGFRGPEEEPTCVHAGAVILATGGAGALFARTDNPQAMTGSGYALAHHAGLDLTDMEFIQFYPLCLATSSRTSRLLPPVLGEIGTLNNAQREDIAHKHAVQPRPLAIAARDKLCQAMMLEVSQGRGHDGGHRP